MPHCASQQNFAPNDRVGSGANDFGYSRLVRFTPDSDQTTASHQVPLIGQEQSSLAIRFSTDSNRIAAPHYAITL
jgi:hypothetical protein